MWLVLEQFKGEVRPLLGGGFVYPQSEFQILSFCVLREQVFSHMLKTGRPEGMFSHKIIRD